MKTFDPAIAFYEAESEKQPHFVFELYWNTVGIGNTYFTSSADVQTPSGADVITSAFISVSGQTQKIKPDIATSEIGSITVQLLDIGEAITTKIGTKLTAGDGLRGKVGKVHVGYYGMPFSDYDQRVTYIIDEITYRDGVYTIKLSDIQRSSRKKIFSPKETQLKQSIGATDKLIPVTTSDLTLFPTFEHATEYTVRPGETVGYAKLEKEVVCYSGMVNDASLGTSLVVIERGALNTKAVAHTIKTGTEESRRQKITEHIYIEGAAPKIIYALLTGNVPAQTGTMPAHWHLGISTAFVKLTDFETLGNDYWNTSTGAGRFVRIENPGTQDGKRYIEKELLLWLGAFMPVYTDGSIGIRRLKQTLADSSYNVYLNESNVKSYGTLTHAMQSVINNVEVRWNYVDAKKDYTKTTVLIDAASNTTHGISDVKKFQFKAVHTGQHTDEDILTYFDTLRDRYSGPPLLISAEVMPTLSMLEVGDTVHLDLDQIRDFTTSSTLSRVFEVQQVGTNWMTGNIRLALFGSSQKSGEMSRTTLSNVLNDSYYPQEGTELSTVLTISAGAVTASGTLTGHLTDVDNTAAIYYYNGDLTINAGIIVSITNNVQLRIRGSLQINGTISGVGTGATGGVATRFFTNGLTTQTYDTGNITTYIASEKIFYNSGQQGFFGTTISPLGFITKSFNNILPPPDYSKVKINGFYETHRSIGASALPYYPLLNNTSADTLTGYPADLRGNSGISGTPYIHDGFVDALLSSAHDQSILANGGAGGNGGAGLLTVVRGMAFGGSGKIDLSGGNSSTGASYTQTTGDKFWGSSGAPGAPGALIILIDGNATNPDIDNTNFIASFGDAPIPAGATEIGIADLATIKPVARLSNWTFGDAVQNKPPYHATENTSLSVSAHRVIYIPRDEAIQEEVGPLPANVTNFSALQNGSVVVFRWDANPDPTLAGFEIRYGQRGATNFTDATPLTQVTKGTSITSADVPPGDWTFFIAAVNDSLPLNYSETPSTVNLVVTSALDVIYQQAQGPAWSGTLVNFVIHHTGKLVPKSQNLASADGWDTFDIFVINPFEVCTYEAPEIDITFDDNVRVWGSIESALGPGETTGIANPALSIDYRLAAGAYDGFESWGIGDLTLRYCKQKLTLNTADGVAYISQFIPTVDVLEHTVTAENVSVIAAGITITFAAPFHNVPFVRVFAKGTTDVNVVKNNETTTGFDVRLFNSSGTGIAGTIDWEAVGV